MAEFTAADEQRELVSETQRRVERMRLAYVRGAMPPDYDVLRTLENLTRIVSAHEKLLVELEGYHAPCGQA